MTKQVWQNDIKNQLISLHNQKKLHHALLFYNVTQDEFIDFMVSVGNVLTASSTISLNTGINQYNPNILLYNDHLEKSSIIPVDAVRSITDFVFKTAHNNNNKIVILPQIENFNNSSANAFLKILEEPPKNVYFIMSCGNLKNIIPTIRSRSHKIRVQDVQDKVILNNELYILLEKELANLNKLNVVKISENIEKLKFEYFNILMTLLSLLNEKVKNFSKKEYDLTKIFNAIDQIKQDLKYLKNNMQLNKRSSIEGILFNLC